MVEALNATRLASRNANPGAHARTDPGGPRRAPGLEAAFHVGMDTYLAAGPTEEQQALLGDAEAAYDAYHGAVEADLGPLAVANDYAGWYAANKELVSPHSKEAEAALTELTAQEAAAAAADRRRRAVGLRDAAHPLHRRPDRGDLPGAGHRPHRRPRHGPRTSARCRRSPRRSPPAT